MKPVVVNHCHNHLLRYIAAQPAVYVKGEEYEKIYRICISTCHVA